MKYLVHKSWSVASQSTFTELQAVLHQEGFHPLKASLEVIPFLALFKLHYAGDTKYFCNVTRSLSIICE